MPDLQCKTARAWRTLKCNRFPNYKQDARWTSLDPCMFHGTYLAGSMARTLQVPDEVHTQCGVQVRTWQLADVFSPHACSPKKFVYIYSYIYQISIHCTYIQRIYTQHIYTCIFIYLYIYVYKYIIYMNNIYIYIYRYRYRYVCLCLYIYIY